MPPILRYMGDRSSFLDTMFSTRRGMIEWFTKHLPNDDSDWIDLIAWMAIRREIEEGRAHVPEDLKEAVGGCSWPIGLTTTFRYCDAPVQDPED